jgi:hypothetical protein
MPRRAPLPVSALQLQARQGKLREQQAMQCLLWLP